MENQPETYLAETAALDFLQPQMQQYVAEFRDIPAARDRAVGLYRKVRDGFLYDPYHLDLRPGALKASAVIGKSRAWCVEKAIVCCAGMRALGIPARLGFGIVQNHIGAEKLVHYLKKDEIVFHGFVEVLVDGRWSKCTPAFDRRICRINKVEPLDWNGGEDSLFQEYRGEEKYMEYQHFYGSFGDVPFALMYAEMKKHYPHLFSDPVDTSAFSFRF